MMKLNHRGDTIIEVMIAIAITGMVLAGAYATASRAMNNSRQAQERVEATKYAEGQLEQLKLKAKPADDGTISAVYDNKYKPVSAGTNTFCLVVNGSEDIALRLQAKVPAFVDDDSLKTAASGTPSGAEIYNSNCALGTDGRYKLSIEREDTSGSPVLSTFTLRVRWERLGGGKDEVVMKYRLNRGQF